jgi:hypothetical protein
VLSRRTTRLKVQQVTADTHIPCAMCAEQYPTERKRERERKRDRESGNEKKKGEVGGRRKMESKLGGSVALVLLLFFFYKISLPLYKYMHVCVNMHQ